LLGNCQVDIKLAQKLIKEIWCYLSTINSCFVNKVCVHNLTANWQQKSSKLCIAKFTRFLLLMYRQMLLHKTCLIFAVRLHEYICPYFAKDLLLKYVSRFCYVLASILSTWFDVSKFVFFSPTKFVAKFYNIYFWQTWGDFKKKK